MSGPGSSADDAPRPIDASLSAPALSGAQMMCRANGKAPRACDSEGLDIDTTNDQDFATGSRHRKAEATQIAELALAGHIVHKGKSGDYLVCKYGLSRYCQDFEELRAFARKLGVSK